MKINCPKNLCNNYYIVFFHSLPLLVFSKVILGSPVSIMRPFILFSKVFQIKRVQDEELMLVVTFTCLLNHMIFYMRKNVIERQFYNYWGFFTIISCTIKIVMNKNNMTVMQCQLAVLSIWNYVI